MITPMTALDATLLVLLILSPFLALAWRRMAAAARPCFTPRCPSPASWRTQDERQWCHNCLGHLLTSAGLIEGRAK